MKYDLVFQDHCVGEVEEQGRNFPSIFGTLKFCEHLPEEFRSFLNNKNPEEDSLNFKILEFYLLNSPFKLIDKETRESFSILVPFINQEKGTICWRFTP